jgi:hypothetical protein
MPAARGVASGEFRMPEYSVLNEATLKSVQRCAGRRGDAAILERAGSLADGPRGEAGPD